MSRLIGVIEEISRRGEEELSVNWRIPNFPSLLDGSDDWYGSPAFRFGDGRWRLNIRSGKIRNLTLGSVCLYLWRNDGGPPKTFHFSVGIRGSGGVENRGEGEREFSGYGHYSWDCSRTELAEHRTRLIPEDTLTITCVLKRPGAASGISSFHDSSTQTDGKFREPNTLSGGSQPLNKTAASDDYAEEENNENNNGDEDNEESKNKKNVKLVSQVKNTKKISFPARHGNVIRSLKAILAEGRRADFTLKSGGGEWAVHRAILEGRSGHFQTLFRGEWAERDEVRLDNVAEGTLDGVLNFVYAGEAGDMSVESLCGTYVAAHQFLLEDLKSLCVEYMKDRMCPEMVCGALAVAETYGEGDLMKSALECFFRESDRIFEMEEWKNFKGNHPAIIAELLVENFKKKRGDPRQ